MTVTPRLRAFLPYYGAKWQAAPLYPPPTHRTIVEPFAGAAGYATLYPDRQVHLYDLNEKVCAVWDYLIHATPAEIRRIPASIDHVDELPARYGQEVRWLVGWWLQPAASGPRLSRSTWGKARPTNGGYWSPACRERLAGQVDRIRHWTVTQASYTDIKPRFHRDATWFVDPPYQDKGYCYPNGSRDIDFQHLAGWCRRLRGQVIVCENTGADWLPFRHLAHIQSVPSRSSGRSAEAIWTNTQPVAVAA